MAPTEDEEAGMMGEAARDAEALRIGAALEGADGDAKEDQSNSGAIVIAAVLVGLSLLLSAFALSTAVDRSASLIAATIRKTDIVLRGAIRRTGAGAEVPVARIDPAKEYALNTAGSPAKGPASAKVTLVEFGDFQCPFSARATPTLRKIARTYGDDVRIVFKHLPLPIHPKARAAHLAAEAAHRQGKFWQLHDKIFSNQATAAEEKYREWASEIGLDMQQFEMDLAAAAVREKVDADAAEAAALGVTSTPAFFVNGHFVGRKHSADLEELIDRELGR